MQVQKVQQQQTQQVQAQQGAAASRNETVAGASTFGTSEAGRANLTAVVESVKSAPAAQGTSQVLAANSNVNIATVGENQGADGK